ncbi:NAD(P)-binding protein [Trametes cingulata]|nr:NAD(P)-binding protein [Trametes cingulata]
MPSLAIARAANAAKFSKLSYFPVAVFVGGTSGIGQATAEAFARHTSGNAHIIIVGRNKAAADAIIASFPKPTSPEAKHEFLACDVSLMKNIQATTSGLLARLPKVNFLVLSPGLYNLRGRDETEEGIDRRLGLHYYARWKFIYDLLPLLRKAKDAGEDAKVLSVLGAGHGGQIDLNDLGMKKSYGLTRAGLTSPTYTDLMMETFAQQHPDIAFIHTNPGGVRTPILERSHPVLASVLTPLLYPLTNSPENCAEFTLYALQQTEKGFSRRNPKGDDIGKSNYYGPEEARIAVWEHTKAEVDRALNTAQSQG